MLRRIDPLQIYADVGGKTLVDAIKFCEKINEQYNRRHLTRRRSSTSWHELGRVQQVQRADRSLRIGCENGWIELYWPAPNVLRARLRTLDGNFSPPDSATIKNSDLSAVTLDISESEDSVMMRSSSLVCHIQKKPFRLRLETYPDRRIVCADLMGMQWGDLGDVRLSMTLTQDEACYGLGMRAARLNLRGKRLRLWNADPGSYKRDTDPLYYTVPLYLGVKDELAYGIYWDNPSRGTVELGITQQNELAFEAENGELRYYMIAGGDANAVLARYAELTGRIEMPPLWALGYGQAQFNYASLQELSHLAKEFRSRGMPCETLYLDVFQSGGDRVELKQIIAELHALQFKVIATLTPAIEADDAAQTEPNLLRYPDGAPVTVATWLGVSHLLDFSSPAIGETWTERIAPLIESGVDGLTLELAEPTVFSASGKPETLPDYAEQISGTHDLSHNLYAAQMAQATETALRQLHPEKRPVIVTRSGYGVSTGLVWTGSNAASWEHLRLSIPMILNMSLSGLPLTGVNVGGYLAESDGELFTRWLQAACLLPLLRADSFAGVRPRQPWTFGQPYELINRLTLELRNKLLPYLYAQIALHREYGLPVVRPLFMVEPENRALHDVDDAYLVGDILVAPVLEKGVSGRTLHLPRGLWYDYWTNEAIFGGKVIEITAALERLPLFVRAGAVLPEILTASDTLLLHVYPGDSENVLYEDSGVGLDGESGNYRWVYVTCEWDEDVRFFISRRTAGSYQPAYKTIRVEVVGLTEEPVDVKLDRQSAPLWYYDNGVLELTAEDSFRRIEIMRRSIPGDRTITHRPW
ncbi:MAG: TIM-barrel domain-containing protein [Chloroflexota bacterium]